MNHYSLGIWQIGRERIIHLLITLLISTALAKYIHYTAGKCEEEASGSQTAAYFNKSHIYGTMAAKKNAKTLKKQNQGLRRLIS